MFKISHLAFYYNYIEQKNLSIIVYRQISSGYIWKTHTLFCLNSKLKVAMIIILMGNFIKGLLPTRLIEKITLCLVVFLSACFTTDTFAQSAAIQKIVIIRHGEKPVNGDNLSCKGFNRAKMLTAVLNKKFGVFNCVFVPALIEGKHTKRSRMFETIIPYAVKYNIDINTKYDETDFSGTANGILKKSGNILLVWEHKNIPGIVNALGIKAKDLKWDDNDFDSIWIITYLNGRANLSKDRENINPSANCD